MALLPSVKVDDGILTFIARLCAEHDVDGLRADIVIYKAAQTLAAYEGRTAVTPDDVLRVAEMALMHRMRRQPFDDPEMNSERLQEMAQDILNSTPPDAPQPDMGGRYAARNASKRRTAAGRRGRRCVRHGRSVSGQASELGRARRARKSESWQGARQAACATGTGDMWARLCRTARLRTWRLTPLFGRLRRFNCGAARLTPLRTAISR